MPLRALLAGLALALCALAADLPSPESIRNTAATLTKDLEVQTRLPNDSGTTEASTKPPPKEWDLVEGGGFSLPTPAAVFDLMFWALMAIAVIALVALIAVLVREPIQSRFRPAFSPGTLQPAEPAPAVDPRELLARADRLAAGGQYAEAMHCVLLAATAILGHGQPSKSADSLTSWELVRAATLAPAQLQALRDLVIRVERAWFGQRPVGDDDYRQARGSFQVFAEGNPA